MRFSLLTIILVLVPNVISTRFILQRLLKNIARLGIDGIDGTVLPSLTVNHSRILPSEMIEQENFPSETHHITTEDGYILIVHRIPGSSNSKPVLLQHGLLESSADWLLPGRGKSLAYILSENGYDVWLGNARGNTYSRSHQNLSTADPQFWNFSIFFFYIWEQLGRYDQPAVITYITNLKNQSLFYIGHSMGATSLSVMAIERPDVAKKVKAMITLAPATYVYHTRNFLKLLAPVWKEFQNITNLLGIHEFLPHYSIFDYFAKYICSNILLRKLCEIPLFILAGFDPKKLDDSLLPKIWQSFPAGTSIKLFTHFLQQIHVNEFRRFDYGSQTNLKVYKSINPPLYDLSKVRVPVAAFWAANDWIVGPKDVKNFYNQVPLKLGIFRVKDRKYNHFDFLWAVDAPQLVYNNILDLMKNFEGRV